MILVFNSIKSIKEGMGDPGRQSQLPVHGQRMKTVMLFS
jgi:hypothetical protein